MTEANIAFVVGLLADPSRAAMCLALAGGEARPAGEQRPDADGDRLVDPLDDYRPGQCRVEIAGERVDRMRRRVGERNGELVAPHAGRDPVLTRKRRKTGRHLAKHQVAGVMTEPVVQRLEIVDIDAEQGHRPLGGIRHERFELAHQLIDKEDS